MSNPPNFASRRQRFLRGALIGLTATAMAGCATIDRNQPLEAIMIVDESTPGISEGGYRFQTFATEYGTGNALIALALSGGGKRSAAFSYGFLNGLRQIDTGGGRSLLDEVDVISGVSGGTFTASYYGLYRDQMFDTYVDEFLRYNLEGEIANILLAPWNWQWAVDPFYGTNDAMAEVYDDLYLDGATYADLQALGPPLITINATDITRGSVFSFNQTYFDLLCSDLQSLPVSRAIAASNGFPVLFTPITLDSYSEQCDGRRPQWMTLLDNTPSPVDFGRLRALSTQFEAYLDPEQTRYVHLMDGGIADNLAMRGMLNALIAGDLDTNSVASNEVANWLDTVNDVVLVSVDGQAALDDSWAQQPTVSGLAQIISLVSGTQIDQYNIETLALAEAEISTLARALTEVRCQRNATPQACQPVQGQVLHYSLQQIPDEATRERLEQIPTGLTIPDEDVDLLVQAGTEQALNSPQLNQLAERIRNERIVAQR
ncbi:MAG: patatin-like phospholipase family protein [Pseudomonadota bacterium]